jgi:hypothetical protein
LPAICFEQEYNQDKGYFGIKIKTWQDFLEEINQNKIVQSDTK